MYHLLQERARVEGPHSFFLGSEAGRRFNSDQMETSLCQVFTLLCSSCNGDGKEKSIKGGAGIKKERNMPRCLLKESLGCPDSGPHASYTAVFSELGGRSQDVCTSDRDCDVVSKH